MKKVAILGLLFLLPLSVARAQTADFVDDWLFPQVAGLTTTVVKSYNFDDTARCISGEPSDSVLCGPVRELMGGFSPGSTVEMLTPNGSGRSGEGVDGAGALYYWLATADPVEQDLVIPDICDDLNDSGFIQGDGLVRSTHLQRVNPDGTVETLLKIPQCVVLQYRPGREPQKQVTIVSGLHVDAVQGAAYFIAHSRIVDLESINGVVQRAWALVRLDGIPGVEDVFQVKPRRR